MVVVLNAQQRRKVEELEEMFVTQNELLEQVRILKEDKRVFEDALRARDDTIAYLRRTIQDVADKVEEAV